jgi:hypothetical protein
MTRDKMDGQDTFKVDHLYKAENRDDRSLELHLPAPGVDTPNFPLIGFSLLKLNLDISYYSF